MALKNEFGDMTLPKEKLYGIYRGVVVDNNDPDQTGRCRIRIYGIHSQETTKTDTDGIPNDELPWAEPVLGLLEGSLSGQGLFSLPLVGSHVMVFFENGNHMQIRYFASVPAKTDWANGAGTYPHNVYLKVHSGHYFEVDSSPGNERIKVYHKTGTLCEIDKDGNIQLTGVKNQTINITNDVTQTVGGNESDTVTGNNTVNVSGNVSQTVGGDESDTISGSLTITVTGNTDVTSPTVTINGNLVVNGTVASSGTMTALKDTTPTGLTTHIHGGVDTGLGSTQGTTLGT